MSFAGTEEPTAYGEIVSIGGLGPSVNKSISAAVAEILESKLSVPKSRFYLKFSDVKVSFENVAEWAISSLFWFPYFLLPNEYL